jgi:FAD/FMN-containing dehydrogenase
MHTTHDIGPLDGHLLSPGEPGYDTARTVWNAAVDRRPRFIVRAATVGDVVTAVRAARRLDLEIGVRCGGHSVVGLAVPEDGLMIDLTPLSGVQVDPERRIARVEGGALLGALDLASQEYGLATTAGNVSHTGVGGLTLGGGMGWLARQYGLSCDNTLAYELVTADGELVHATADENPELFWGLRGGGGNFGIVTAFTFRLHETGTRALSVELDVPVGDAVDMLRGWRDLSADMPRRATLHASVGGATATVGYVWIGDPDEGRRLLPALRALGRPSAERVEELSYVDLQRREDTLEGHEQRRYWKGHYLRQFPDDAVEAFALRGSTDGRGDMLPNVGLQAYGGAIAEVADDDSAFSHRDVAFEYVCAQRWTDPAEDEARMAVARRAAATLEPFASGAYVNALSDEGQQGVRRAYPAAKLARLQTLKATYDPHNVFHLNHNIAPR